MCIVDGFAFRKSSPINVHSARGLERPEQISTERLEVRARIRLAAEEIPRLSDAVAVRHAMRAPRPRLRGALVKKALSPRLRGGLHGLQRGSSHRV